MSEFRPTSIFVIGLLSIAIGCIGVVWNGAGAISLLADKELADKYYTTAQKAEMAAIDRSLTERVPYLSAYRLIAMQCIPWLLTVGLLVGGVGLVQCRPWSRSVLILYALMSIVHKIGMAVYSFVFLLPMYKTPISILQLTKPQLAPGAEVVANIVNVAVPLVLMVYPIMVLVVMYRPAVVVALRARPVATPAAA